MVCRSRSSSPSKSSSLARETMVETSVQTESSVHVSTFVSEDLEWKTNVWPVETLHQQFQRIIPNASIITWKNLGIGDSMLHRYSQGIPIGACWISWTNTLAADAWTISCCAASSASSAVCLIIRSLPTFLPERKCGWTKDFTWWVLQVSSSIKFLVQLEITSTLSGTNKSFIPEEIIYAHHELNVSKTVVFWGIEALSLSLSNQNGSLRNWSLTVSWSSVT